MLMLLLPVETNDAPILKKLLRRQKCMVTRCSNHLFVITVLFCLLIVTTMRLLVINTASVVCFKVSLLNMEKMHAVTWIHVEFAHAAA